jgi:hypothetical protein
VRRRHWCQGTVVGVWVEGVVVVRVAHPFALGHRHEKRVQYVNITVSALRMELLAKNEKNDELQELLDVAHDERDAAREKEEEYFNALRRSEDTIASLKKKCRAVGMCFLLCCRARSGRRVCVRATGCPTQ